MAQVVAPPQTHWVGDGFRVHNFIPSVRGLSMQEMDPFIMLDYNAKMEVAPTRAPGGVGVHPHRGFETVTIAYEGEVEHRDSAGHGGVIGKGDVQWMTAASGVLHTEYHSRAWAQTGGAFQMVQLWVNLPARDKMGRPKYQSIKNEAMGRHSLPDGDGEIEVIAGQYGEALGAATTHTPIHMLNARLARVGARAGFAFPCHYTTLILVIRGRIDVDGVVLEADHLGKFSSEGEHFTVEALEEDTVALILAGEPIREPIAAYGPFVMNTKQEIMQAFEDFNAGRFGTLAD